ncbi:MAG: hypothetical protein IPL59_02860 [Candidatus Competibacteraceae bacterium]|nr:hypothetical protein [Candidatus Competibacteraceae bacterium]
MTPYPDVLVASDYVVCATLRKIADMFNVDLLWNRVRGGQEGVMLLEALKRYPRTLGDRQRQETRYSHVIVRIPERDYVRDDRLEDGFSRRALLQELRRRHEQEMGDFLAERSMIRYRLESDPILRPGEVQFLFGRAIYLPSESETPAFWIQATAEKASDWRDVAPIYSGQRLTLLNGDRRASSVAVTAWPFPGGESVLLLLRSSTPALVDVVAEPAGSLTLTGDGEGGFTARDRRGRGLRLRVTVLTADVADSGFGAPAPAPVRIMPESRPVPPPVVTPVAVHNNPILDPEPRISASDETCPLIDPWGRREPVLGWPVRFDQPSEPSPAAVAAHSPALESLPVPEQPTPTPPRPAAPSLLEASPTPRPAAPILLESSPPLGLDQHTWIPQQPAVYLRVIGIALQRLSVYAAAGISDWRIGFSRAGGLVLSGHPDAAAWLRVDSADRLFGDVVGLAAPLDLPGIWRPFPDLELELEFHTAPSPMTTHYLGWVRLPVALSLPVPRGRAVSFGRGSEADIAPRLLADPRALRWDGNANKTVGINAEYLGLSRRHLLVQARRDDWWVQVESQNMPVYQLAASGDLLDVLNPGLNTATTAKPGELLVVGGYVLALGEVG